MSLSIDRGSHPENFFRGVSGINLFLYTGPILSILVASIFTIAIVLNATANILIKASALEKDGAGVEGMIRGFILNPWMIAGIASFGLALIAYRFVLNQGIKVSIAYPVMTTSGYAIVLLASRYFFQEQLNGLQWLGILLLVVGLWLISSQMVPGS